MSSATYNSESNNKQLPNLIFIVIVFFTLLASIIWVVSRSFANSYFAQSNIPYSQISLSIWEYANLTFVPLMISTAFSVLFYFLMLPVKYNRSPIEIIYSIAEETKIGITLYSLIALLFGTAGTVGLIGTVAMHTRNITFTSLVADNPYKWLYPILISLSAIMYLPLGKARKISDSFYYQFIYLFTVIATGVSIIGASGAIATLYGKDSARRALTDNPLEVELILNSPLIGNFQSNPGNIFSNVETVYIYYNLHLFVLNSGSYFLYDELDQDCKPVRVYTAKSEQVVLIEYIPVAVHSTPLPCHGKPVPPK